MRSYLDLSIRQKLQTIVMVTSAVALLVASVVFTLYDRSTFLRAKTQDLSASRKNASDRTAPQRLSFGDAQIGAGRFYCPASQTECDQCLHLSTRMAEFSPPITATRRAVISLLLLHNPREARSSDMTWFYFNPSP